MLRALFFLCLLPLLGNAQPGFVSRKGSGLRLNGAPYYFSGTNYWYGGLLPLLPDTARGIGRLRRELDFLKAHGITSLRVLAGAEGSGPINGVPRVGPPLQPRKGVFDAHALDGLDVLLAELGRRDMKAVIFFSNNWEWSGGFLQYLNWNGLLADSVLRRPLAWDEMRDIISRFYTCAPCRADYEKQVAYVLNRRNTVTGRRYVDDPAIMAWELVNEPRPMRPAANAAYADWIRRTAAFIKSKDRRHLVTLGHEGAIGTESAALFEQVHADPNVDYSTIHIWPRNWGWVRRDSIGADFPNAIANTEAYIREHIAIAQRLRKPLVLEEFGFPRDDTRFAPGTATGLRDRYYELVYGFLQRSADSNGVVAGASFWAFNGSARPLPGQVFWKPGNDYMGDPPMEEQSLYGVYDSDSSTWRLLDRFAGALRAARKNRAAAARPTR
ncbi:MAG: beta-mannosidase [Chitinophagaceae bacterium]|nr:MAG: beta-mannosidase [Chitinophagaceae bacterium]